MISFQDDIRSTSQLTESLLEVQPRVAEGLVSQRQLILPETHAAAQALRDAVTVIGELASELKADAVEMGATLGVNAEARSQLADDGAEVAGLEATRGGQGAVRDGR